MFGPVDGEAQGRNGDPLQHRVPPPTPLPSLPYPLISTWGP